MLPIIIIGEGEFIIPALVSGRCKQIPEQENDQKVVYRVNKNSEYFPKDISNIFLNRKYLGNEIIYLKRQQDYHSDIN